MAPSFPTLSSRLPTPTLEHSPESVGWQAGILREVAGDQAPLRPFVSRAGVQAPHRPSPWLRRSTEPLMEPVPFSERRMEKARACGLGGFRGVPRLGKARGCWENLKLVKQKLFGQMISSPVFALSILWCGCLKAIPQVHIRKQGGQSWTQSLNLLLHPPQ